MADARRGLQHQHVVPGRSLGGWLRATFLPSGRALVDAEWEQHHAAVLWVLAVLALVVPVYAVGRGDGAVHGAGHAMPLVALTAAAAWRRLSRGWRQGAAVLGLMSASALVVHASGGATEAHFMFFALLPLAAVYASRAPFVLAVGFVAIHHFALGSLAPGSVFPRGAEALGLASLHAAFVVLESLACHIAWRLFEDRREAIEQLVTARTSELRQQRDALARLAAAVDSTDDSVIMTSRDGVITGWNGGAQRLYGYTDDEVLGRHVSMLVAPESHRLFTAAMDELGHGRSVHMDSVDLRKDGTRVPTAVTISTVRDDDGRIIGAVGIARDVTERHNAEERSREINQRLQAQAEELTRLAYCDPVTGLGNRAFLARGLDGGVNLRGAGLIVLDLDDFKLVNDSLGHATGDRLLLAAGERLAAVVQEQGMVTRLGGDEFAVLLTAADEEQAVAVAERILAEFDRDFVVHGHALRTTASIGISTADTDADAADLLRAADLAMYAAKAAGKGKLSVYQPHMLVEAQQRLDLESHLRHALQRGEMHLAYQPIIDAATGRVRSVEALLRWRHPTWGAVSPATFIPVAEMSGTIIDLGAWVLRQGCHDARKLLDRQGRHIGLSVNVSVRQLQAPGFVATVRTALDESGLAPPLLTLEVTESLLMEQDHRATVVLRELHELGVHLSIDDFGTGHSSLARLRKLPVGELKIDRSFVSEIGTGGDCGPIITAVVAMARALGLSVVAEGVETAAQLKALRRLGCDSVQGFLLGRPGPLADVPLDLAPLPDAEPPMADTRLVELVTALRAQPSTTPRTDVVPSSHTGLVREALAELVAVTGLDTVYLTRVDLHAGVQHVLLAHSSTSEIVPEGLAVAWADTVCKRACETGRTYTTDVASCCPDSRAAIELGLVTYIGVPIRRRGEVVGTLCGASTRAHDLTPELRTLVEVFAHVIAPQLDAISAPADRAWSSTVPCDDASAAHRYENGRAPALHAPTS